MAPGHWVREEGAWRIGDRGVALSFNRGHFEVTIGKDFVERFLRVHDAVRCAENLERDLIYFNCVPE